ncbi:MAG: hypothetical protein JSV70_01095 [bacterium]|nr:MAG: hypothetical protein JSV70_01095 [bacterium]
MAQTAKMIDVVVAGRMARMKVVVKESRGDSALRKLGTVLNEAMRLAGEAELSTRPRSDYRKALIN